MAKDSDNLAGSLDTENLGGLLTGFLAEEEPFDRRALWRIGTWGVGAVGAVIIGVLANQSSIGSRREQLAAADLVRQSQQIQSIAKESQNETRRLASAIDTLNGDRDRLYSRITVLEQGLESVTGAIARQKSAAASASATPAPVASATPASPPPAPISAAAAVQAATQSPNPPPVIGPVATISAASADRPHMEAANAPPASPTTVASLVHEPATAPAAATAAPATAPNATTPAANTQPAPPAPLMESKSMMAPPDAAATKLIEPETPREAAKGDTKNDAKNDAPKDADAATAAPTPAPDVVASAPSAAGAEPTSTQSISQPAIQRTEFAIDVGGANSIGGLRALWRGLLKSRSNAPLAALHPIIVVKESRTGLGMQLRLVAGPLGDAAAAAKICAAMIENQRSCETTVFDGQRLAMTAGEEPSVPAASAPPTAASAKMAPDKPTPAKPVRATAHRHSYYSKRVTTEDPAKKPDPPPSTLSSTLSSYFSSSKDSK
jgi:hypothetical protein